MYSCESIDISLFEMDEGAIRAIQFNIYISEESWSVENILNYI